MIAQQMAPATAVRPFTAVSIRPRKARIGAIVCQAQQRDVWKMARGAGTAALVAASLFATQPAWAELNKFEEEIGGEFGRGTAQQYGEADIKGKDFSKQSLQRSNFTAADCRDCNFEKSNLTGAYFIKAVVARANFRGADLSDTLSDRAVFNDAILTDAIMVRGVYTRSDFGGAEITNSDWTNALVDKAQQMQLCKRAIGTNPITGADTRKSLGCGSRRAFKESSPSNPEGPQVSDDAKKAFQSTQAVYRK